MSFSACEYFSPVASSTAVAVCRRIIRHERQQGSLSILWSPQNIREGRADGGSEAGRGATCAAPTAADTGKIQHYA